MIRGFCIRDILINIKNAIERMKNVENHYN